MNTRYCNYCGQQLAYGGKCVNSRCSAPYKAEPVLPQQILKLDITSTILDKKVSDKINEIIDVLNDMKVKWEGGKNVKDT